MNASTLKATLGVGALAGALFLTGIGSSAIPGAFAQDATPAVPSGQTGDAAVGSGPLASREAAIVAHYETFLGKMATELGATDAEVDAAIRAALKGTIDDAVAAGDLAVNRAAEMKQRIDESPIPVPFAPFGGHGPGPGGMRGPGGMHGPGGSGDRDERGSDDGRDGPDDDRTDEDGAGEDDAEAAAETASPGGLSFGLDEPMV